MTNKIPEWGAGGVIQIPGDTTRVGCVYCLAEGLEAPVEFGVVYYWLGTSLCTNHAPAHVQSLTAARDSTQ